MINFAVSSRVIDWRICSSSAGATRKAARHNEKCPTKRTIDTIPHPIHVMNIDEVAVLHNEINDLAILNEYIYVYYNKRVLYLLNGAMHAYLW